MSRDYWYQRQIANIHKEVNMKLLPIVPGCRAILLYAHTDYLELIGQTVIVDKILHYDCEFQGMRYTSSDSPIWLCDLEKIHPIGDCVLAKEKWLMRIDGGEFEEEKTKEAVKIDA